MPDPSVLPIVARLDEAEAIADNTTDKITDEIVAVVGAEAPVAMVAAVTDCTEIFFGATLGEQTTARVVQSICSAVGGLLRNADFEVSNLLLGAANSINGVIGEVEALVGGVTDTIVDTLNDVVDTVADRLDQSVRSIIATADDVVRSVGDFVADLVDRIDRGIEDTLSAISFAIASLISAVGVGFNEFVVSTGRLIERIDSTVRAVGMFLVDLATDTLDAMSNTVASVLGPLIGAGESVLGRLGDVIESVPGSVREAASTFVEGVGEFVGDPLGKIGEIFVTQVEAFFAAMVEDGQLSHGEVIRTLLTRFGAPAEVVEKIAAAADDAAPVTPGPFVAALAFLVPLITAQFIGSALEPVAEQLRQEIAEKTKQALIPPVDLLDGLIKGDISEARLREDFAQWGFTEERQNLLLSAFRSAPDASVAIRAWLRELIEENELDRTLFQNRMRPEDIALLKQVVFFIPPAQDLIRMAVREVFSPEIRERFGQDEDFPEEFATFARQQGISDEWARAYWAAHWALPSPAQGFEMLHRKVIEPADLDVLLRALDVMPFWREKLTQIAFSPLTRVDLRRMHALGLLTDADLQLRYEAIGFAPADAELMVAFTVAFNFSEDELPDELEGLTRASILGMFEDGIVERGVTVELLTSMGIGADAAELFVEQRELEQDRKDRRNLIESVVSLAGGGRISLPEAQDSLASIGLTAVELTRATANILRGRDSRDRLPSLADLRKMLESEIIDDAVFLETLKASGFDDVWALREFELITGRVFA